MAGGRFRVVPREIPPELIFRLTIAGALMVVVVALLVARLWFLQVVEGSQMRLLSENNRIRLWRVPATRGLVYDRHGALLIDNRPSFDIVLVPEDARDRAGTLSNLARYLEEDRSELDTRIRAPSRRPPYAGIVVDSDVEWRDVVALETHQLDLPGVSIQVRPRRFYPRGPLAAHLLGYVGEVSERELADRDEETELRAGDYVGKAGLERVWDEELRGVVGGQQVEVDALGRRVRVIQEVPDVAGDTLVLTLDADLQDAAGQAMGERRGSCVALDPRNGEVLAMVSRPDYDPNLFARGIRHAEWQGLIGDEWRPLTNRAVQGQYAPGSIFKVAVAAGLLDSGVVTPSTGYTCRGGTQLGNRLFRCWKRGGHGYVNLHRAIVQSCDVFFYQAGQRLGVDGIAEYAQRFGLGAPTGIGISTEASGLIPTRAWKQRRFGAPWYPGETLPVAIGQGYVTVTPLQMASMVAVIANGGVHYRPHYVRRLEAPDGTVRREIRPDVMGYANISPDDLAAVRRGMRDVVMAPGGTGRNGQVPGIEVAGKTGTAQVVRLKAGSRGNDGPERTRDHAWFIAFAPVEEPEIAVACLAEHAGGGGGAIAAPIVSKILSHYFARGQGPVLPPDHEQTHADRSTSSHTL
jgi:penicillin-binding protein 2